MDTMSLLVMIMLIVCLTLISYLLINFAKKAHSQDVQTKLNEHLNELKDKQSAYQNDKINKQ
jgi:hypothetical protein